MINVVAFAFALLGVTTAAAWIVIALHISGRSIMTAADLYTFRLGCCALLVSCIVLYVWLHR